MKGVSYFQPVEIRPGEFELPDAWGFAAVKLDKAVRAAMQADARITNYARAFDYVQKNQPELVASYEAARRTRKK